MADDGLLQRARSAWANPRPVRDRTGTEAWAGDFAEPLMDALERATRERDEAHTHHVVREELRLQAEFARDAALAREAALREALADMHSLADWLMGDIDYDDDPRVERMCRAARLLADPHTAARERDERIREEARAEERERAAQITEYSVNNEHDRTKTAARIRDKDYGQHTNSQRGASQGRET